MKNNTTNHTTLNIPSHILMLRPSHILMVRLHWGDKKLPLEELKQQKLLEKLATQARCAKSLILCLQNGVKLLFIRPSLRGRRRTRSKKVNLIRKKVLVSQYKQNIVVNKGIYSMILKYIIIWAVGGNVLAYDEQLCYSSNLYKW